MRSQNRCWHRIKSIPNGHKFFRETNSLGVAIADQSGPSPDTTDDGVLWLNFAERTVLTIWVGYGLHFRLPILDDDGNQSFTPICFETVLWLMEEMAYRVVVADKHAVTRAEMVLRR